MLHLSLPLRLSLNAVLNSVLAFCLHTYLPQYITIVGGAGAYVIFGSLLTLMNFLVRPLLNLVSFPFKLIATLLTIVIINHLFLWIVYEIALKMDPNIIAVTITGGLIAWLTLGTTLGVINWLMKHIL